MSFGTEEKLLLRFWFLRNKSRADFTRRLYTKLKCSLFRVLSCRKQLIVKETWLVHTNSFVSLKYDLMFQTKPSPDVSRPSSSCPPDDKIVRRHTGVPFVKWVIFCRRELVVFVYCYEWEE